eukprot:535737-Hanusia_phi.AAC.1
MQARRRSEVCLSMMERGLLKFDEVIGRWGRGGEEWDKGQVEFVGGGELGPIYFKDTLLEVKFWLTRWLEGGGWGWESVGNVGVNKGGREGVEVSKRKWFCEGGSGARKDS